MRAEGPEEAQPQRKVTDIQARWMRAEGPEEAQPQGKVTDI